MTPNEIDALCAFLLGLGAGFMVHWILFESYRRAAQRKRLQLPPFTTEGQGR